MPVSSLFFEHMPQPFDYADTPQVGLGDLDGDGDLDVVLANMGETASQVWFNDGAGQFVDSGQQLTPQGHGVGVADLDNDGDLDVFITCANYDPGDGWHKEPSKVYLNDGRGTFQDSGQDIGDTELSGTGLNLIDLDSDQDIDVHVVYYDEAGMADKVYLNDGTGYFSDSGLELTEDAIAWGDLNTDGDVDILAKILGEGYRVLLNDGAGQFVTGWELADSRVMRGDIALADFDSDGDLDALIANGSSSEGRAPTRLLLNDGTGQFTDSGQELNKTVAAKIAVGDLDQDGSLDVFVSNAELPNEVWLNDGRGRFTDSGLRLEGSSSSLATRPSLGDLDGDGDLDVVVAVFWGRVEVWLNRTSLPPGEVGLIAFHSARTGNGDIYVMGSDGSNPQRITTHIGVDYWPSWSPDGTQIAFGSARGGESDIYVINVDGTELSRLTKDAAPDWEPAWSPQGDRIAFCSPRDGDGDIYIINTDGSDLVALTDNDADDGFPSWSPDGSKIAFSSNRDGVWEIYVMAADGTNQVRLTNNEANDWVPVWSPDGRKIVFTSERDGNFEIYVMNADGSGQTRLTNNRVRDMEPSWSPDGSLILFNSNRSGNHEIYSMEISDNLEPGEITKLTENRVEDDHPVWKPEQ